MNAAELIRKVEREGGSLTLRGGRVRYQLPSEIAPRVLPELRSRREEVIEALRQREAADAVRRFGQPHARLFPYLGRKVRTPEGPGTLLQIFAERVTVLLDSELSLCSSFLPSQIGPVSGEW